MKNYYRESCFSVNKLETGKKCEHIKKVGSKTQDEMLTSWCEHIQKLVDLVKIG